MLGNVETTRAENRIQEDSETNLRQSVHYFGREEFRSVSAVCDKYMHIYIFENTLSGNVTNFNKCELLLTASYLWSVPARIGYI